MMLASTQRDIDNQEAVSPHCRNMRDFSEEYSEWSGNL